LLQLNPVGAHGRNTGVQFGMQGNIVPGRLIVQQRNRVFNYGIHVYHVVVDVVFLKSARIRCTISLAWVAA
jgi:hypothetical protein